MPGVGDKAIMGLGRSVVLVCSALAAGCGDQAQQQPTGPTAAERASVALRVVVVNDPGLAEAINRLRGEWSERQASTYSVAEQSWEALEKSDAPDADVIIVPTRYMGELAERDWLRPVRQGVLESDVYQADDVLPLVRNRLCRYGGRVMALSLGVQVPLVCYREDLLEATGRPVAETWQDYQRLVESLEDRLAAEPLDQQGAYLLLARAASLAVAAGHDATLFDSVTMTPRIAEPPFVRALESIVALEGQVIADARDPCVEVFAGRAAVAIGLPPAPVDWATGETAAAIDVVWSPLPGSDEVYITVLDDWQPLAGGRQQVPLLGTAGQFAAVTEMSRNAATAFRLLGWLASAESTTQFGPSTSATLPFRHSQLAVARRWFGNQLSRSSSDNLAAVIGESFSEGACLVVPRVPGIDDYLEALQSAVDSARSGSETPLAALEQASARWEEITEARGREKQRGAYLRHLNLAE